VHRPAPTPPPSAPADAGPPPIDAQVADTL
jgi:hypothetical protein